MIKWKKNVKNGSVMCLGKMTTATVWQHPGLQRADVGPQNNMEANTREREKKKEMHWGGNPREKLSQYLETVCAGGAILLPYGSQGPERVGKKKPENVLSTTVKTIWYLSPIKYRKKQGYHNTLPTTLMVLTPKCA